MTNRFSHSEQARSAVVEESPITEKHKAILRRQYPKNLLILRESRRRRTLEMIKEGVGTLSEVGMTEGEKGRDALRKQHSALFIAKARAEAVLQAA